MISPYSFVIPQFRPLELIPNAVFEQGFDFNPNNLVCVPLFSKYPPIPLQPDLPAEQLGEDVPGSLEVRILRRSSRV